MSKFAPINIISGYSFLQSGLTIDKIQTAIKKNDYFGMGLADNEVMHGIPAFIKAAGSIEKPFIVGIRIEINKLSLLLYCTNEEGYLALVKINNTLQNEDFSLEKINNINALTCVLETKYADFKELFSNIEDIHTKRTISDLAKLFKKFYLGIEVTSREDIKCANSIREFARAYEYDTIASPRIRYVNKDDAIVVDLVNSIASNQEEALERKSAIGQEYFMKETDYAKIYTASEMENTVNLVKENSFDFAVKRGNMLKVTSTKSVDILKEKCLTNLGKLNISDDEHKERLEHELSIINEMGYSDYFLLVEDYVNYAKTHGILVGPGRGSAAGSLVSYLLNITEVDPLEYNLQFERFLNPFRKTMPDIDVDFMDIDRDAVVQYMRDKYGQNRVANIVAFQTIKAKQSIRDIGRIYKYPQNHIDLLCKRLTNDKLSLRESYKKLEEFRSLVDSDKYFLEIVSLASKIEGLPRQRGMHAAGVILNNEPLDTVLPVSIEFNGNYVSQYEAVYLEEEGLLKMDFLGLTNLTTIFVCLNLLKQKGIDLKFEDIPYKDEKALEIIRQGQTMGLFQIESSGMNKAIRILQPTRFEDIVALLALFRPGPMDSIQSYSRRKSGRETIYYYSDSLKPILEETYGIIVYQEQVNSIARVMAGFSMGEADLFRRAISKKKVDQMVKMKDDFVAGATKNGYDKNTIETVYNLILKFADYGFNKSHAVVYAITCCRMAYLKARYPLEFYSSILQTTSTTNDTKFNLYVSEMKKRGLKVLRPNVNKSTYRFEITDDGLLFPLTGIHGINEQLTLKIMEERKANGPYKDFFDFIIRMTQYKISDTQIHNLIDGGAMDIFSNSRESMRMSVRKGMQYSILITDANGQLNLGIPMHDYPTLINQHDNPIENLNKEYTAIGIMLSDSPLAYKKDLIESQGIVGISSIDDEANGNYKICGIIKDIKTHSTKKKQTMAFLKVFDDSSEIEVTVFSDAYQQSIGVLKKNNIVVIEGSNRFRDSEMNFIANKIYLLEEEENDA